ncbi:MAG: hypothetical protein HY951_07640 [Bacteroidia bacterium]|nr:hypothetical protein [Bacteroidia bacterium]
MRNLFNISAIVLLVSLISFNLFAQETHSPTLKFILGTKKVITKDITNIEKLDFTVENLSSEVKNKWKNSVLEHKFVKELTITEIENSNIQNGELVLNIPNSFSDIRKLIESFKISEFYVGDVRILTKTFLNNDEALKKAMDFKFKDFTFNTNCNDSSLIDYYDFQVYYFETKIQHMWSSGYAKYLFDGTVTKFTEQLDRAIIRREEFKKNNK